MYRFLSAIGWYSFVEGASNLIRWFPVIWKDRDYNEEFIYAILHKKLEHIEKFFRSDSASLCVEETADCIKAAKDIAKRLEENLYFVNLVDHINANEFLSITDSGKLSINRNHPGYKEWQQATKIAEQSRAEDKKKLFQLMHDNIDSWWG
jgi:hypothetical protein